MAGPPALLKEAFERRFHAQPELFRAPGRVNLIGEHTDYNLGFVLPIAIDLACYTASAPNPDGMFRVHSLQLAETREWPVGELTGLTPAGDWTDYVIGVARQIPQASGRDLMIYSTVPIGAGLSSSAALEVSTALACGWVGDASRLELAQLARRAENDFVGLPSGIMDQYVCVFGQQNAALQIDCRSLTHQAVRLPENVSILAVNSEVKHALAGKSAYAERVAECARAAQAIGVASLRDARLGDLSKIADPIARKRAHHIITENQRVAEFVIAAREQNLVGMGHLFTASHRSLKYDYEVSCPELDFLVDSALLIKGAYGARMTGGGFGGCTVNLVDPSAVPSFESQIRAAYRERFQIDPAFYSVEAAQGASRIR